MAPIFCRITFPFYKIVMLTPSSPLSSGYSLYIFQVSFFQLREEPDRSSRRAPPSFLEVRRSLFFLHPSFFFLFSLFAEMSTFSGRRRDYRFLLPLGGNVFFLLEKAVNLPLFRPVFSEMSLSCEADDGITPSSFIPRCPLEHDVEEDNSPRASAFLPSRPTFGDSRFIGLGFPLSLVNQASGSRHVNGKFPAFLGIQRVP